MLPYQIIDGGSFTSDSTLKKALQISDRPDLIWLRNRTAWGDDADEVSVESWWRYGMNQDSAQTTDQAVTTGILSSEAVTSGGFRVYNTSNPPLYAALATTAGTAANPAVFSMANTGSIQVGDVVRLTSTTGMLQIAGYDFEVAAVTTNVSISLRLDSSGFLAAATSGNVQLFVPGRFYPRWRYIVPLAGSDGITKANNCVVSFSVAHNFTVGERVSFRVPTQYGMDEIDQKSGIVQSVTTYTITVDIDTSSFTTFAIPASAVTGTSPFSPAIVLPAGAGPKPGANPPEVPLNAAFDNRNQWVLEMGSNVITSVSAVYDWVAFKYDRFTP